MVEYQAGFRKNYSSPGNIYNLASDAVLRLIEKKKLYAFFVVFGVSYKFVRLIESIYETTLSVAWNGEYIFELFGTFPGVKRVCLLSPLLFASYINYIHEHLGDGQQ